jgi:hypothetical protein
VSREPDICPAAARSNTIQFANPAAYAPDFDRILVAATPS